MAYYKICPDCGATLDPGESCDCKIREQEHQELMEAKIKADPKTGQYSFQLETQGTGNMEGAFA